MNGFLEDKFQDAFGDGKSVTNINELQRHIHDGTAYKVTFTSSATTSGDIKYLQINGVTGYEGHLKSFTLHGSAGFIDVKFIECSTASTHTTGSAGVTAYNKNRTSANTANLAFFSDPTDVNSTANNNIVIDRFQVGGTGTGNFSPAISDRSIQQDEWLIGNSTYIVEMTCTTTEASFYLNGSLIFYEEASTSIV